jgi:hypothetical protein
VLLPAGDFPADERTMMLCHELMHVRRRDLAWGWIPAAAARLFFFHPLAHLASREYLIAREAACDAAVVRALDVASADYARMLVRCGATSAEPALAAGGSSRSFTSLRRRLEMLHDMPAHRPSRWGWIIAAAVAALVPLQLGARETVQPAGERMRPAAAVAVDQRVATAPSRPVTEAPRRSSTSRQVERATEQPERVVEKAAMRLSRSVEERLAQGDGLRATRRAAEETVRVLQDREVVRVLQWQDAAQAQREIERALQELTDEYYRRAAEMKARADQQARTDAEQGAAAAQRDLAAREAMTAQIEEAARALRAAQAARTARGIEEQVSRVRETVVQMEEKRFSDAHPDLVAARRQLAQLEEILARTARTTRDSDNREQERREETTTVLREQIEQLHRQQEALLRQLYQIAEQQEALMDAQRRLSEQADRIRREVEAR